MKFRNKIFGRKTGQTVIGIAATMLVSSVVIAEPITVVSWGGTYGAAQDNALFNDASDRKSVV